MESFSSIRMAFLEMLKMANLNSMLIALITVCFGMASGIFFVLYCLEEPIYSSVFKKKNRGNDSDMQMRRVLLVLQQFLRFRVPIVMVTLIILGTLGTASRLVFYGFDPLSALISLSGVLVLVTAQILVKPAIKVFKSANPEASSGDIQTALAPIVGLHRNVGFFVAVILILQLVSVAFYS